MSDIKDYKQLGEQQISIINELKSFEENLLEFIDSIVLVTFQHNREVGKDKIKEAFMWLVRSVARED